VSGGRLQTCDSWTSSSWWIASYADRVLLDLRSADPAALLSVSVSKGD
jgi:hypothetical protein